jgi:hypothetical protein
MNNVNIGDRIIFSGFGADTSWRITCTVFAVSDPGIGEDPALCSFSGMTDGNRAVGGYFDQVIEVLQAGAERG